MIITGEAKVVAAAYVKARSEIESIMTKDTKGARGKYVKLASIIEAISPVLFAHELVLMQEPTSNEFGVGVSTCIMHSSGASIDFGPLTLPVADNNPHTVGSALSYARRYAISAVFGLAAEDDDGQAAQDARQAPQKPQGEARPALAAEEVFEKPKKQRASAEQIKELGVLGLQYYGDGWKTDLPKLCLAVSKGSTEDINELLPVECSNWIATIKKRIAANAQEPIATVA